MSELLIPGSFSGSNLVTPVKSDLVDLNYVVNPHQGNTRPSQHERFRVAGSVYSNRAVSCCANGD